MFRLLAKPTPFVERKIGVMPEGEVLICCGAEWAADARRFKGELVVLEKDPGKLVALLERHPEIEKMHLYDDEATLNGALEPYMNRRCAFVGDDEEAREAIFWLQCTWQEHLNDAFYINFFKNIQLDLFDWRHLRFDGVPAIICGAGPSLDHFEPPGGLLFAAGSALPALASRGILPHFAVGVDPNPAQFQRMMMQSAFEVPLLFCPRMHWHAVGVHHGPRLYVSGTSGYALADWCEEQLGIAGPQLEVGYNCVHMAVELARQMGCNPITLAGVDHSFIDGRAYASGVEGLGYEDQEATLRRWRAERAWLDEYAKRHAELHLGEILGSPGLDPIVELRPLEKRDVDVQALLKESLGRCRQLEEGALGWFELEEEIAYNLMVTPIVEVRAKVESVGWKEVQEIVERLDETLC